MKWLGLWFIIMLLMALSNIAIADDPHGVVIETAPTNTVGQPTYQDFTAAAIATAQIHPELGTQGWQIGLGVGFANDEQALAIGGHKRFNKTLWGGTVAIQNGELIGGFGANFKFP